MVSNDGDGAIIQDKNIAKLIVKSDRWIEHIADSEAPYSHRMFAAESYYNAFWEHSEHAIILLDDKCNILEANPAFCEMVNVTAAEATSKNFQDLIPSYHYRTDYVNIKSIIKGDIYSVQTDNEINHEFTGKRKIPVRIVATRVPSSLQHPFRHIVMHIYELDAFEGAHQVVSMPPMTFNQTLCKSIQEHFAAFLFAIVSIIFMIALQGHLGDLFLKLMESIF